LPTYRFDHFTANSVERTLLAHGQAVTIGARALTLLFTLLAASGKIVTKRELLDTVWPGIDVEENNIAIQVAALRRAVGVQAVVTVPGIGYQFARPVLQDDVAASALSISPPAVVDIAAHKTSHFFGNLEWRPAQRVARLDGQVIDLGPRAFDVLSVLIEQRHRVVTKQELFERVWPGQVVEENNLQVQVSTLRKALGPSAVATIPGRGYRFTLEDSGSILPASAPALAPARPRRTNLPAVIDSLIGRADEVEALGQLLRRHRLVTILGAGGIGKTRLGLEVARSQLTTFPAGVWWIDLAALRNPPEVTPAIATAVGVQLGMGDVATELARVLDGRKMLVLLDNCEHQVDALERLASVLISDTSDLWLLNTSQVPLGVSGEQLFRVEPLSIPPTGTALEAARRFGAIELLEQRAQAAQSRFALNATNLAAAIEICARLDGLPLAIEMAASRLPLLGFEKVLNTLQERLHWLKSPVRRGLPRQQTLQATLDWSYSLLTDRERTVLRRLSVFAGTFPLDAAQRVAALHDSNEWDVVDAMAELVDHSLLQVQDQEPPRYRLLESTRAYGMERLAQQGESAVAHEAHLALMADIGNEAEAAYWTTPDEPWLARYAPIYDDLQAAFTRACEVDDGDAAAATLDALFHIDELRGVQAALPARLETAWRLRDRATPQALARIAWCRSSIFMALAETGDGTSKRDLARAAAETWRRERNERRLFLCLMALVVHATIAGDHAEAERANLEASALETAAWPARLRYVGARSRSAWYALRCKADCVLASTRAELAFAEAAGSPVQAETAKLNLADATLMGGNAAEAVRLGREVVARVHEAGWSERMVVVPQVNLMAALVVAGDLVEAREVAVATLAGAWRYQRGGFLADHLSLLAARSGRHAESMRLIGWADAWWVTHQYAREGNETAAVDQATLMNVEAIGASEAARLRAEGAQLPETEARRLAESLIMPSVTLQHSA